MKNLTTIGLTSILTAALLLFSGASAFATSATWTGGSTDASWSDPSNWNSTVPGALGTTNNTDTATFNAASPAFGTGANPVIIDPTRNILNLNFDLAAGPYVIGSTSGNALTISAGGTIQNLATMTSLSLETINAPLTIESGTTTIQNNSTTLAGLQINGTITDDQTPATPPAATLVLAGTNTSKTNIISGVIDGGANGGTLAITKSGAGYWDITGNNSDLAQTTTISGGTLSIGNSNALGIGNISLSGGSLAADTALTLGNNVVQGTAGTAAFVSGSNNISTTGNLTFTGGTSGAPSIFYNNMTGGGTFSDTGVTYLNSGSTSGYVIFSGAGNTSLSEIDGSVSTATAASPLDYYGSGTLTLNGTDKITGGTESFLGGTVVLNFASGNATPRLSTGALTLGSNLVLSGGTGVTTSVASTTVATGTGATYYATITAPGGSGDVINLGTLNSGGFGTINIQPGTATTTSASSATYGTYGSGSVGTLNNGWVTVGNGFTEDFATTLSNTSGTATPIIAIPTYYDYIHTTNNENQGVSLTPNAAGTNYVDNSSSNFGNPWKIDTSNGTAAGTYSITRSNAAANFFVTTSLLYTGFANYTIQGEPIYQNQGGSSQNTGNMVFDTYGPAALTISSSIYGNIYFTTFAGGAFGGVYSLATGANGNAIGGNLLKSGNGTLILTGTNNYVGNTEIAQGTLSIGSDSNLGGVSGNLTLVSSSTSSNSVTVSATGFPTTETLVGASFLGSTITEQAQASGGNVVLTLAGNANVTASSGTYNYANGQQSILINGTLQATGSFTLGETASSGSAGSAVANYRPIIISADGATIDVTGSNVLTAPGVVSAASGTGITSNGTLTKIDTGTLILSGTDTYTGGTFVDGGTLELSFNPANGASSSVTSILAPTGALTLAGGTLNVNSATTGSNAQTLASLTLSSGNNTISATNNGATSVGLTFTNGNYTRAAGSTVDFVSPANTSVTLLGNTNNPFLGNYAFFGTGATEGYAATTSAGVVQVAASTPATGANSFTSATANYTYTSPGTPDNLTGNATANTVIFDTGSAQVIDLNGGANTLTLNGFINNGGALTIQRSSGTGTLAIGSGNELVIGGSTNVTISAPISGAGGALTDANTGTLTLSGVNTYTGATTVNSGTLSLSGGSVNGSNITTAGAGVVTEASGAVISGTGTTFTQAGTGTSTLSGINTYTGLTTVSNGELDLGSSGQAIAGNLAVSGGTAKMLAANQMTGSASVSGGTLNVQGFNQSLSGVQLTGGTITGTTGVLSSSSAFDVEQGVASAILGGSAGLTKTTTGTVLLSGANTYTGTTTIGNGTIYISALNNLGGDSSAVVLGGTSTTGDLSNTSSSALTFTRGFTVNAGGGEIDNSANALLTIGTGGISDTSGGLITFGGIGSTTVNSVIGGGSGGLTVNLDGTLTLAGLNTYTGATTINAGVVSVSNIVASNGASNLGNATSAIALNNNADLSYTGPAVTFTRGVTIGATGGEIDSTAVGQALTISTGGISDSSGGTVSFGGAGNTIVTSVIGGGAGGLKQIGTGSLTLSGANTYTGATTITSGTLYASNIVVSSGSSNLGNATSAVSLGGGTLAYTGNSATYTRGFALTANSEIDTTTAGQTLTIGTGGITGAFTTTFGGAGNTTVSSVVGTGAGGVTKINTGTLTLQAADTYTGVTTIDAGTVQVGNGTAGSLSSADAITFNGGTLNLHEANAATQTLGALTFSAGDGVVQSTYGTSGTTTETFASLAARTAGATGNFVLSGGSAASNLINITGTTAGQELGVGYFFGGSNYAVINSAGGPVRGMVYTGTPDTGAAQNTGGTSAASTAYLQVTGNLTAQATGTTFTGINLSGTPNITLASGAAVKVDGLLKSGTGSSTISGGTSLTSVASGDEFVFRTDQSTDLLTISTNILANGTNALTKSGAGTLTLSGANTYTGVTTVDGGTLSVGNIVGAGSNIGSASSAVVLNGGDLSYTGASATYTRGFTVLGGGGEVDSSGTGLLTISGGIVTSNQGLTTFGGTSSSGTLVTGIISGNGGVTDSATGTVTLQGVNTYTGPTTINSSDTLAVTGAGQLGSGAYYGNVTDNGTLTVGTSATQALTGAITGSGALTQSGSGTLTLSGANTYTGPTTISSGTLLANSTSASSTGQGSVTVGNGGTLGGNGSITPAVSGASVTIQSGGTLYPGGTPSGTVPNGNLTLVANATVNPVVLTLNSGALLKFNLGASNTSSELVLSINTPGEVAFNNNVVSVNDLTSGSLSGNYILFAPTSSNPSGSDYSGLTLNGSGVITSGLSLSSSFTSVPAYANSYFFENTLNGDIELNVNSVPEPGTWALMILGLMVLAGYRYRQDWLGRAQASS